MVGICSTIRKRAKRTLDATVETTIFILSAAAAVGVEDKQIFNFGHAAMRPQFGQKH